MAHLSCTEHKKRVKVATPDGNVFHRSGGECLSDEFTYRGEQLGASELAYFAAYQSNPTYTLANYLDDRFDEGWNINKKEN